MNNKNKNYNCKLYNIVMKSLKKKIIMFILKKFSIFFNFLSKEISIKARTISFQLQCLKICRLKRKGYRSSSVPINFIQSITRYTNPVITCLKINYQFHSRNPSS